MDLRTTTLWGNSVYQWLIASGSGLVAYILLRLITWLLRKYRAKNLPQSQPGVRQLIRDLLEHTVWFFLAWLAVFIASRFLVLSQVATTVINTITATLVLIQAGLWAVEIIKFLAARQWVGKEGDARDKQGAYTAILFLSKIVVWTLVIVLILENIPGIHVATLIASLGIGGIAIGLALQKILGDLFASLTISIDQPFTEGDAINVGDFSGQVEHVGLKSTRLRSISGEQVIFSNTDLLDSRIRNFKRMDHRQVVFSLNITYQTSPKKLHKIPQLIKEIIEKQPHVTFNRAHFKSYSDSALVHEVAYTVNAADFDLYMDIQQKVNLEIFRQFRDEGIEFAYPTRTILFQQE
ncbi:MAG: mechanosensitive ion channel family protein [Acidobacteriaceae bacterium]